MFSSFFLSFSCLFFSTQGCHPTKRSLCLANGGKKQNFSHSLSQYVSECFARVYCHQLELHLLIPTYNMKLISTKAYKTKAIISATWKTKGNQSTFSRKHKTALKYWLKIRIYPFISRDPPCDYDMYLVW